MTKKEIPITIEFDKTKQIGVAFIDSDALPPGAGYCFKPTFEILEMKPTEDGNVIVKAELIELALTLSPSFSSEQDRSGPVIKGGHKVISPNPPESRGFKGRKWGTKVP